MRRAILYQDDGVAEALLPDVARLFETRDAKVSFKNASAFRREVDLRGKKRPSELCIVIPGGRDLPYLEKLGGLSFGLQMTAFLSTSPPSVLYLGICAGAYFACEALTFLPNTVPSPEMDVPLAPRLALLPAILAIGPIWKDVFRHGSESGATVLQICPSTVTGLPTAPFYAYYNGGCLFYPVTGLEGSAWPVEVTVLATFTDMPIIVQRRVGPGGGRIVATGIHLEVEADTTSVPIPSELRALLAATRPQRQAFIDALLDWPL